MITILDYGMGNLGSLENMFKRIGVAVVIESNPNEIAKAEKLVLPGIGSFDTAMKNLFSIPKLRDILDSKAFVEGVPILGICLGMQIMTCYSEEGQQSGLGWISGKAYRFPKINGFKVPHMGWNVAQPINVSPLTIGVGSNPSYYFVHSYFVHVDDPNHSLMRTQYGIDFDSAIRRDNIYGVQFHPEKSHSFGLKLLKNFAEL